MSELEALPPREMRRRLAGIDRNRPGQRPKTLKAVFQKTRDGRVREAAWVYLRGSLSVFTDQEILSIARNESSSAIRALAMNQIVDRHLWDGIPVLIDGMRDPQPGVRKYADQMFEKLFGIKTDYEYNSTVEDRQAQIRKIEQVYPQYRKTFEQFGRFKKTERKAMEKMLKKKADESTESAQP
ncbi:MAG: hypothetical protein R3236_03280 [Phycisphaeraceae bacterium]|nr:hypothetical protein [Phycisphaeraceae bacterium]